MITQSLNSSQSNEEDVIVWMPFVVKMKHLQSPLMTSMNPPQPISVQPIQQAESPAPLPPSPAATQSKGQRPRTGMASTKQKDYILNLAKSLNMTESEICQVSGVKSIEQMTNAQANDFITKYKDAQPQF